MLPEYILKVVIIGDSSVGKTSLTINYVDGTFTEEYQTTIGVDFKLKELVRDDCVAKLQLWDTAGQDRFRSIASSFYRGAEGLILMFDVTKADSFAKVPYWLDEAMRYGNKGCVKLLVGNKIDLANERQISTKKAQEFADQQHMAYVETSAKTSTNVHKVFDSMADKIIKMKMNYGTISLADDMSRSFRLDANDAQQPNWCYGYGGYCY